MSYASGPVTPGMFDEHPNRAREYRYDSTSQFVNNLLLVSTSMYNTGGYYTKANPVNFELLQRTVPACASYLMIEGTYTTSYRDLITLLGNYADQMIGERNSEEETWYFKHLKFRTFLLCCTGLKEFFTVDGFDPASVALVTKSEGV